MILNEVYFFSDALGFHTSMYVLLPKRTLSEMKSNRAVGTGNLSAKKCQRLCGKCSRYPRRAKIILSQVYRWADKVPGSKHDLMTLAKKVARGSVKPRLYQCCGMEDQLYEDNLRFRDVVRKLPLDLTCEEGPGEHNWAYWDKMIQRVLVWMFPVRKKAEQVPKR